MVFTRSAGGEGTDVALSIANGEIFFQLIDPIEHNEVFIGSGFISMNALKSVA